MIDVARLKDIREDKDITQEEMANILNVNRSAYSLWELGINIIPLKNVYYFAKYFGLSIDYVLGLTNERNNKSVKKEFNLQLIGNNLKTIRLKNGLYQKDIATLLNVTPSSITKYEKGITCMSISSIFELSKKFNISIEDFCTKNL